MNPAEFGVFLSEERKARNLTQKELAKKVGVTDKAVSKWERGVCLPDVSKFDDIADALGLTDLEVLRAKRIPPDQGAKQAPPLVSGKEFGVLLLGCLVSGLLCFPGQLLEMAEVLKIIPLSSILQVILSAGFGIWYAFQRSRGEAWSGWRSVCDWMAILISLGILYAVIMENFYLVLEFPMRLMKVDAWSWKELLELYHWSPFLIVHFYLRIAVFDFCPFIGLFLCLAMFPSVKFLRIYYNFRKSGQKL